MLTSGADLRDASCRPDPDFEWLTLGLCRPGLRKRIARLAATEPIELLFYSRVPAADMLLLVALLRVVEVHANHADARAAFKDRLPRNLIVPGNPCLLGTEVDPEAGRVTRRRHAEACGCDRYVQRSGTPYLRLTAREQVSLRCANPVPVEWERLRQLSRSAIGRRWSGGDFDAFQRATQNGAHWIADPDEAEAIRQEFLSVPHSTGSSARAKGRPAVRDGTRCFRVGSQGHRFVFARSSHVS